MASNLNNGGRFCVTYDRLHIGYNGGVIGYTGCFLQVTRVSGRGLHGSADADLDGRRVRRATISAGGGSAGDGLRLHAPPMYGVTAGGVITGWGRLFPLRWIFRKLYTLAASGRSDG